MNILTASTLDFIEHLRKATRGWRIDPMVQPVDGKVTHNGHTPITPPPANQSYTHFFAANQSPSAEFSLIRIKIRKRHLRIIQCRLGEDDRARSVLTLSYWRANGFRQNETSVFGAMSPPRHPRFNYDKVVVYQTYLIERMTKGTKNRGKKRPGKPSIIHRDRIDVAAPDSAPRIALIAKATIEKSFERTSRVPADNMRSYYSRMAVIIDGKNFRYEDDGMIVARVEYE